MDKKLYQCRICKLYYQEKSLADKCNAWCSKNPSCNLAIARQSIEAKKGEKGNMCPGCGCC